MEEYGRVRLTPRIGNPLISCQWWRPKINLWHHLPNTHFIKVLQVTAEIPNIITTETLQSSQKAHKRYYIATLVVFEPLELDSERKIVSHSAKSSTSALYLYRPTVCSSTFWPLPVLASLCIHWVNYSVWVILVEGDNTICRLDSWLHCSSLRHLWTSQHNLNKLSYSLWSILASICLIPTAKVGSRETLICVCRCVYVSEHGCRAYGWPVCCSWGNFK